MPTIAAGGTAQNALPQNANRHGFEIQNQSAGSVWFNEIVTAVQGEPSWRIDAGETYRTPPGYRPTGRISIIGATTGQQFAIREW